MSPYSTASFSTPSYTTPTVDQSLHQLSGPKPYDYYHGLASQAQLTTPASAGTRTFYVDGQNLGEAARAPWYNSGDAFLAARSGTNDVLSPLYYLDAAYTARAALDYSIGKVLGGVQDIVTPPTAPSRIDYHADGSYTFHDDEGPPTIVYANQAALLAPPVFSGTSRAAGQFISRTAEPQIGTGPTSFYNVADTGIELGAYGKTAMPSTGPRSGSHPTTYVPGRYAQSASKPGAYWTFDQRVFPTTRNSGLKGAQLRNEQEAFFTRGLQDGKSVAELRGQAAVTGYERRGGINNVGGPDRLADRGAENSLQRAIQNAQESGKVGQ